RRAAVEAECHPEDLPGSVEAHRFPPSHLATLVLEDHRERLGNFAERQDIQSRIEDVERERAAGREMSLHTRETRELGVDVEQMRKRAERSRHETKHAAEVESTHVDVDRLHVR